MGPRAGMDGRKISSPPGFDPGPSSPWSVAIPWTQPTIVKYFSIILGIVMLVELMQLWQS